MHRVVKEGTLFTWPVCWPCSRPRACAAHCDPTVPCSRPRASATLPCTATRTANHVVRCAVRCCIHPQVVADEHLSLHEIKVTSKTGEQRRRQQRQAEKAARGAGRGATISSAVEEVEVSEVELQGVPVLWVQVSNVSVHHSM